MWRQEGESLDREGKEALDGVLDARKGRARRREVGKMSQRLIREGHGCLSVFERWENISALSAAMCGLSDLTFLG